MTSGLPAEGPNRIRATCCSSTFAVNSDGWNDIATEENETKSSRTVAVPGTKPPMTEKSSAGGRGKAASTVAVR